MKYLLSILLILVIPIAGFAAVGAESGDKTNWDVAAIRSNGDLDTDGGVVAAGNFAAVNGTLSGNLAAVNATLSGAVSAATMTAGAITDTDWTDGSVTSIVSSAQYSGVVKKLVLTLEDYDFTITYHSSTGGVAGVKIYDFPEGYVYLLGSEADLTIATAADGDIDDDAESYWALGTVVASDADVELSSTEANILAKVTVTHATDAGDVEGALGTPITLDGTTTANDVYLNATVADADMSGNEDIVVNGTITLWYILMGDE